MWSVRASTTNRLDYDTTEAEVSNIECQLSIHHNWVPPIMPSYDTMLHWVNATYGTLMDKDADQFANSLEWTLNQLTMVAGTGNKDILSRSDLGSASLVYGCVLNGTSISYGVWILLGLLCIILIPMSIATLFMVISGCVGSGKRRMDKAGLARDAPTGVGTWQLALLKQSMKNDEPDLYDTLTEKNLYQFSYGYNPVRDEYRLNRNDAFKVYGSSYFFTPSNLCLELHILI
jgi:hypothetical protein